MSAITTQQVPRIRRGFRLQWEPAQSAHVLLYPEGMIKLNDSAAEILKRVDGERSLAAIIDELKQQFPDAPDIDQDILSFMEVAVERFWVELR